MSSQQVYFPSEIDVSKITVGQVKYRDNGSKAVPIRYEGKPLRVEVAGLTTSFGINKFVDPKKPSEAPKFSIDLTLDDSSDATEFKSMLETMDSRMIELGVENTMSWYKTKHNADLIKVFYSSPVKVAKDKDGIPKGYPPSLKAALKKRYLKKNKDDKQGIPDPGEFVSSFGVEFYNLDGSSVESSLPIDGLIPNRSKISVILECGGVWFMGGTQFGVSWKAVQIRIEGRPDSFISGKPAFRTKTPHVIADAPDVKSFAARLEAGAASAAGDSGGYDAYDDYGGGENEMLAAVTPAAPPKKPKKQVVPEPDVDVEVEPEPEVNHAPEEEENVQVVQKSKKPKPKSKSAASS